jgi:hypothetical protein
MDFEALLTGEALGQSFHDLLDTAINEGTGERHPVDRDAPAPHLEPPQQGDPAEGHDVDEAPPAAKAAPVGAAVCEGGNLDLEVGEARARAGAGSGPVQQVPGFEAQLDQAPEGMRGATRAAAPAMAQRGQGGGQGRGRGRGQERGRSRARGRVWGKRGRQEPGSSSSSEKGHAKEEESVADSGKTNKEGEEEREEEQKQERQGLMGGPVPTARPRRKVAQRPAATTAAAAPAAKRRRRGAGAALVSEAMSERGGSSGGGGVADAVGDQAGAAALAPGPLAVHPVDAVNLLLHQRAALEMVCRTAAEQGMEAPAEAALEGGPLLAVFPPPPLGAEQIARWCAAWTGSLQSPEAQALAPVSQLVAMYATANLLPGVGLVAVHREQQQGGCPAGQQGAVHGANGASGSDGGRG